MDLFVEKYNKLDLKEVREGFLKLSLDYLQKAKHNCDKRYYNSGKQTLLDSHYDLLLEVIQEKNPEVRFEIGCQIDNRVKVALPFILNSTDKIKATEPDKLASWLRKNRCDSYVISNKLNGQSGLIVFGDTVKLYTRGTSEEGRDISPFLSKIKGIPKVSGPLAVRGEIIIKRELFNRKYSEEYEHALALIVSTTNAKTMRAQANDLEFVAYEIISDEEMHPETNLKELKRLGFNAVKYGVVEDPDTAILKDILMKEKQEYEFDVDGLIIQTNEYYNRTNIEASGNPKYLRAFKMVFEEKRVEVFDVLWEASRWNVLKPRINFSTVKLGGSNINYCSGFNAKFIFDNKIGPGSIITIIKSGEVIPFITGVVKATFAKMPDSEYKWNDSGVDIIGVEDESCLKRLVHFVTSLGIENMNEGVVKKLVDSGYNTPERIVSITKEQLREIPTFKDRMSEKIYNNIQAKLENVKLVDLMTASSLFGMGLGKKKLEKLLLYFPDLLDRELTLEDLNEVEGFSDKTSIKILENMDKFKEFMYVMSEYMTVKLPCIEEDKINEEELTLLDKKYVFSGFRDAELEKFIEERGGKVLSAVSKSTDILVAEGEKETTKYKKALEYGIKIMNKERFLTAINYIN